MEDFIQELKSNKILTYGDIIRLRTYIKNKYPSSDTKQQADILTNSIKTITGRYLKHIPKDQHDKIKEILLKNTLLYKGETIVLYNIFEVLTTISMEEDNFINIIFDWVNCYLSKPIDKEKLNSYFSIAGQYDIEPVKAEPDTTVDPPEIIEENHDIVEEKNNFNQPFNSKQIKSSFQPNPVNILFTGLVLIAFFSFFVNQLQSNPIEAKEENIIAQVETTKVQHPYLPDYFMYKDIDENRLKTYLKSRNSLLEEDPYFSSIINTAREFDLNPLILFAIAGHEQGFVPKSNPLSKEIANNPFNVFISWQEYNTNIVDSAQIAARTVINLSKDRPDEIDPFQWINRKYAEDKEWWKGVRSIFNRLEREVDDFSSE